MRGFKQIIDRGGGCARVSDSCAAGYVVVAPSINFLMSHFHRLSPVAFLAVNQRGSGRRAFVEASYDSPSITMSMSDLYLDGIFVCVLSSFIS